MLRDLGDIAGEIVRQLGSADALRIIIETEVTVDAGFHHEVSNAVSENARTFRFRTDEFED